MVILLTFITSLQSVGFEPASTDSTSIALTIETYDCSITSEEFTKLLVHLRIILSPAKCSRPIGLFGTHRVASPIYGSSNKLW